MQYLRARYYDTGISRFVQEDDYRGRFNRPISMNRYIYCKGNPVVYIDPSGYKPIEHGPTVVIPKPVSAYDAKMAQIEKIIEDRFVNDSGATSPQQEVGSNGVPNSINQQNASDVIEEYNCGKSEEEEEGYWFGEQPLFAITISDDETTVGRQYMTFGWQEYGGAEYTEFKVKNDGSENTDGHINLDIYRSIVSDEYAGPYIEIADYLIKRVQSQKIEEEKFSLKEYLDPMTSAGSGMEINIFGFGISVGSTGMGVEIATSFTNKKDETNELHVGFDLTDSISIESTQIGPVEEDGYAHGVSKSLEVNTAIGYAVAKSVVGLTIKGLEWLAKLGEGFGKNPPQLPVPKPA